MKEITKRKIFIANNLFIFIMTAIMVTITLTFGSVASQKDNLPFAYWQHIVTFTILSNIMLGIVALISAIIGIKNYKEDKPVPRGLVTWYLIASTSATLTFLVVVFYLAPSRALSGKNYFDMLIGPMFFLHFLDPIISAVTFIFFTKNEDKVSLRDRLFAVLPPVIYAIPYFLCVAVLKIVPDFYGLTFGGKIYLTILLGIALGLLIFGISSLLAYCHNRKNALK